MTKISLVFLLCCSWVVFAQNQFKLKKPVQIAFLAAVHLQDIYGTFSDTDYKGIENPVTHKFNTIRTMDAQLHSTRIFNENYFAFLAALDDVARRGIKIVVLPGDFSDDGQLVHLKAFRKILENYRDTHGITFLAITGNHDPVRPFSRDGGKSDFLGENGKEQAIVSKDTKRNTNTDALPPVISNDMREMGYDGILTELSDFGFFPKENFRYWETPFSNYEYEEYTYEMAIAEASLENRNYPIPPKDMAVPDVSYLVEPVDGIWLLALDANVYIPKEQQSGEMDNAADFSGAGTGYDHVLTHKAHLVTWVKKIAQEAAKRNKILIAFSHYPLVDFNDGVSEEMKLFFGVDKMQLGRVPGKAVANAFANAGLKIHFGGHMHINDTGVHTTGEKNTLFNIQIPSLAAYKPAYKILTLHAQEKLEIETVVVDTVPGFNELFPLYEREHSFLQKESSKELWDKSILETKSYLTFAEWHLKELVRLRFIPEDWQQEFSAALLKQSGKDLLFLPQNQRSLKWLSKELKKIGLSISDFETWSGFDMIYDFYRLRNADKLAFADMDENRLRQYRYVCARMANSNDLNYRLWARIFEGTLQGEPADHFMIDLETNSIRDLRE